MQIDDPKSIAHYLKTGSLGLIVQKAKQITAIDKMLESFLPSEMVPYCQVMNVSHKTLILRLDNAAWATRVRYLIPNLIETFSQKNMPITSVQCRVRP